jgi:hypothetical protein
LPNSFRGNYSFLDLTLCEHTGAETNQGRKLFKGRNYLRKYGIFIHAVNSYPLHR